MWTIRISRITQYAALCPSSFTYNNVFKYTVNFIIIISERYLT